MYSISINKPHPGLLSRLQTCAVPQILPLALPGMRVTGACEGNILLGNPFRKGLLYRTVRNRIKNLSPEKQEKLKHCVEKVKASNASRRTRGMYADYNPHAVCRATFFGTLKRRKGRRNIFDEFFGIK